MEGIYVVLLCITVEFDFTDTSPPVLEMVGNVTVCLENASPEVVLDRNVIINIATADGAATGRWMLWPPLDVIFISVIGDITKCLLCHF